MFINAILQINLASNLHRMSEEQVAWSSRSEWVHVYRLLSEDKSTALDLVRKLELSEVFFINFMSAPDFTGFD